MTSGTIFLFFDKGISTRHPCVRDMSTRLAANAVRESLYLSNPSSTPGELKLMAERRVYAYLEQSLVCFL